MYNINALVAWGKIIVIGFGTQFWLQARFWIHDIFTSRAHLKLCFVIWNKIIMQNIFFLIFMFMIKTCNNCDWLIYVVLLIWFFYLPQNYEKISVFFFFIWLFKSFYLLCIWQNFIDFILCFKKIFFFGKPNFHLLCLKIDDFVLIYLIIP